SCVPRRRRRLPRLAARPQWRIALRVRTRTPPICTCTAGTMTATTMTAAVCTRRTPPPAYSLAAACLRPSCKAWPPQAATAGAGAAAAAASEHAAPHASPAALASPGHWRPRDWLCVLAGAPADVKIDYLEEGADLPWRPRGEGTEACTDGAVAEVEGVAAFAT